MENLRTVRRLLDLTQADIASATGIPVRRLSQAEWGRDVLSHTEQQLIRNFLRSRLASYRGESQEGLEVLQTKAASV